MHEIVFTVIMALVFFWFYRIVVGVVFQPGCMFPLVLIVILIYILTQIRYV